MARIRSLHPGQWTDEAFATLSPLAHLLAIGIRNEADDGGVFEWRPIQLKMRLLPMYQCDVTELLDELALADIVRLFEVNGKRFGAIRNFYRFQSPDKPRLVYPRADWVDDYTGRKTRGVSDQSPTAPGGVSDQSPTAPPRKGRERKGKEEEGKGRIPPPTDPNNPTPHAKPAAPNGAYRWQGRIIRVNETDFERWRQSFHGLDLPAHLETIDGWLASDDATDEQRKRWFHVVPGALRKRHEEALAAGKAATGPPPLTEGYGFGIIR